MTRAAGVARQAESNRAVRALGRVGMVCYGVVYVLVAYLAVRVATGSSNKEADQKGALEEVAATSFGKVVLWVMVVGLLCFGLWQLLLAATSFRWHTGKRKRAAKRLGAAVRGVVGIVLGVVAIRLATGSGGGSGGGQQQRTFTAKLLELPGGRLLVGLVALAVIGAGVASVVAGLRASFMDDLDTAELPGRARRWVRRLGMVGNTAKGAAIVIVGVLLGVAAVRRNPGEAGGLDKALRTLAGQPFGSVLLIAMALGFAAFGVYCFVAARSHRA